MSSTVYVTRVMKNVLRNKNVVQTLMLALQKQFGTGTTINNNNNNDILLRTHVHITDTRAQNVFSCTSAHITETVLAHDQHWEEQSSLSSPQLYRHSQKHRIWITIQ